MRPIGISKAYDVAIWFLNHGPMSNKKLQNLIYYAYAWILTLQNHQLFDEPIFAWVHGPIVKSIYDKYNNYGFNEIPKVQNKPKFDPDTEDILNQVWQLYGKYDGIQLESMVHQTTPWKNARKGLTPLETGDCIISDKDIIEYFNQIEQRPLSKITKTCKRCLILLNVTTCIMAL